MSKDQVQKCAFEIAALGTKGIDDNDPGKACTLRPMPGTIADLQLVCHMFVGFKQIAPHLDLGFDVSKGYEAAPHLFNRS